MKTRLNLEQKHYDFKPELCQNSIKMNKSKFETVSSANCSNDHQEQKAHFDKLINLAKDKVSKRMKQFEDQERGKVDSCTFVPMTN